MLRIFMSLFKKKPQYDPNKIRQEALRYVEENYLPPAPVIPITEPVAEYGVSGKEEHPQAQYMTWSDENSHHAQFQQIPMAEDDLLASISWDNMTDAEARSLEIILNRRREKSFSELLAQYIKDRGYRDPYVYRRAQIDKRLFSKIMSDRNYKPAKDTIIAFALALHCSLEEADKLLKSAGYSLSHSSKRDTMIEYFFVFRVYDLVIANENLNRIGEKIIGREKVG